MIMIITLTMNNIRREELLTRRILVAVTALCAASSKSSALRIRNPLSFIICLASFTLVPNR